MKFIQILFTLVAVTVKESFQGAIQIDSSNIDQLLTSSDLLFVNYYANWCRFSQMLQPIWDEFADKYRKENPDKARIQIAKVDCDTETAIATRNNINKYPTMKLYRHGVVMKKEFRGARSVDAFMAYLIEQSRDPIQKLDNFYQINQIEFFKKPTIIGFFESEDTENYKTFQRLADIQRETCSFAALTGDKSKAQRANGDSIIYKALKAGQLEDMSYDGGLNNYDALYAWSNERCTRLVREITFENAEELTEEGLPFLILFHKPDDLESIAIFEREVGRQLIHERNSINAVHADGFKFTHPLHHLGKSTNDLPLLAIDSFRHMYLLSDFKQMSENNKLQQFVMDLNTGKLHREFHNGPDPTVAPPAIAGAADDTVHLPKSSEPAVQDSPQKLSSPPESMFVRLQPSNNRYTFKDEF